MRKHWMELAADLLDQMADDYSNHGCNDWEWPDGWTPEQCEAFRDAIRQDDIAQGGDGYVGDPPMDYVVMGFLAARLRATESEEGEG